MDYQGKEKGDAIEQSEGLALNIHRQGEMDPQKRLLSPKELSLMLNVDITTVYGWTSAHLIPYFKIGRLPRFDPSEIDKWLKERKVPVKKFA